MMAPMSRQPSTTVHAFHRHPAAPWLELRVSQPFAHCFRLHAHDEYSIGIVDRGEAVFHHADGPERVTQGCAVLIEPQRWHACNPDRPVDWAYRMLFVNADWLHAQLGARALTFKQRALHTPSVTAIVDQLCQPLSGTADVDAHMQRLLQFVDQHTSRSTCSEPFADMPAIRAALQVLHDEPEAETSVASLAAMNGMSAPQFIRQFKAATGVTPGVYRLNLRLNGARRLLAQGNSLADAAHRMGFADQAHMQRSFKAHHALTPGNYAQSVVMQR